MIQDHLERCHRVVKVNEICLMLKVELIRNVPLWELHWGLLMSARPVSEALCSSWSRARYCCWAWGPSSESKGLFTGNPCFWKVSFSPPSCCTQRTKSLRQGRFLKSTCPVCPLYSIFVTYYVIDKNKMTAYIWVCLLVSVRATDEETQSLVFTKNSCLLSAWNWLKAKLKYQVYKVFLRSYI